MFSAFPFYIAILIEFRHHHNNLCIYAKLKCVVNEFLFVSNIYTLIELMARQLALAIDKDSRKTWGNDL